MNDFPENDPLEDLLRPQAARPAPDFRQTVLRVSLAVLRRRVWAARLATVTALAACFVAGALTLYLWHPPQDKPDAPPGFSGGASTSQDQPVAALEDRAIQSAEQRTELFRQAGQRYLHEQNDVQAALRCYGHSLDSGSEKDLVVNAKDDWLLIALKHARQEEKRHVRND
jgi:hypothetical protein